MEINKDLVAASSTPIVLAILAEGDSYGYAILKRVRELSGGRMEWTDGMLYPVLHRLPRPRPPAAARGWSGGRMEWPDGMLYPVLHRLGRLGHVEARWEVAESGRRRKYYRITPP